MWIPLSYSLTTVYYTQPFTSLRGRALAGQSLASRITSTDQHLPRNTLVSMEQPYQSFPLAWHSLCCQLACLTRLKNQSNQGGRNSPTAGLAEPTSFLACRETVCLGEYKCACLPSFQPAFFTWTLSLLYIDSALQKLSSNTVIDNNYLGKQQEHGPTPTPFVDNLCLELKNTQLPCLSTIRVFSHFSTLSYSFGWYLSLEPKNSQPLPFSFSTASNLF